MEFKWEFYVPEQVGTQKSIKNNRILFMYVGNTT